MSSALFTAITTTLKGDNYNTWISKMEAFLQATGLGSAITFDPPIEPSPLDTADLNSVKAWKEYDDVFKPWKEINTKAVGNIRVCLSLSIHILTKDQGSISKKLWQYLQKTYKVKDLGTVSNDFAATMAVKILYKESPLAAITDIGNPDHLEALIFLSKLPFHYSVVVQTMSQLSTEELKELMLTKVRITVMNAFSRDTIGNSGPQNMNKFSNVHCKGNDPKFFQQHGKNKKAQKNANTAQADADSMVLSLIGSTIDFGPPSGHISELDSSDNEQDSSDPPAKRTHVLPSEDDVENGNKVPMPPPPSPPMDFEVPGTASFDPDELMNFDLDCEILAITGFMDTMGQGMTLGEPTFPKPPRAPPTAHKLWDLNLGNVEATPYVELRIASPLLPPPLEVYNSYYLVLLRLTVSITSTSPRYILGTSLDLLGAPLWVTSLNPATTRSFLSSVAVPVAPFELQPALSMLQHKPIIPKPTLRPIPTQKKSKISYPHLAAANTESPIPELPNPEPLAEPPHFEAPLEATLEESEPAMVEEPPIHRIQANHKTRQAWVKAGILEEQTEEV
ncbi:hypothetical protein EV359DRAFT_87795 [Lentinula novae-zelandiae]|nr:hypothetical protein EV359DRAFT_87795 [Lentinula novae-zelandiae]